MKLIANIYICLSIKKQQSYVQVIYGAISTHMVKYNNFEIYLEGLIQLSEFMLER